MAGKTKKQGGRPTTPRTPKSAEVTNAAQLGHLGLKSSPYAPTDCKLVSQYMVRDRMAAHYKKLNKAKAAVDSGPPKAYLVSQKMRDQAKREAMKAEFKSPRKPYSSRRHSLHESDLDKADMQAMMESLSHYDDDEVYGDFQNSRYIAPRANTSMELHASDSNSDMQLVNRMIDDNEVSPSRYTINKAYRSNIPNTRSYSPQQQISRSKSPYTSTRVIAQKPLYQTQLLQSYAAPPQHHQNNSQYYDIQQQPVRTPRSSDVIDMHNDKFTQAKPFQPRTLKSTRTSKLSQFKDYTPPVKKSSDDDGGGGPTMRPDTGMSGKASLKSSIRSRPGTANKEMTPTDWMNETIVSRDFSARDSPAGVPLLDITLDGDNINWLNEQKGKAKLRKTLTQTQDESMMDTNTALNTTYNRPVSRGSTGMNGTRGSTGMNGTRGSTGMNGTLNGTLNTTAGEEELQYLAFVQDVTSDVLDRGIFTNRMLKQVFESQIIKRRHQLDENKMRDKLDDLRIELGIPKSDDKDYEGVGLTSTLTSNPRSSRRAARKEHVDDQTHTITSPITNGHSKKLPNLHHSKATAVRAPPRTRSTSPDSKPPLPASRSGGKPPTPRLDTTSTSSLGRTQELTSTAASQDDGDSVFGTVTRSNSGTGADILKVDHEDDLGETLNTTQGFDDTIRVEEQTIAYQQQLQDSMDRSDDSGLSDSSLHHNEGITQRTDRTRGSDQAGSPEHYSSHSSRTYATASESSEEERFTERTESHSPDFTPVSTSRSSPRQNITNHDDSRQDDYEKEDDDHYEGEDEDDFEKEDDDHDITPRQSDHQEVTSNHSTTRKQSPVSPSRRGKGVESGGALDSARSHNTNTTISESVEVSELDETVEGEDDDDEF